MASSDKSNPANKEVSSATSPKLTESGELETVLQPRSSIQKAADQAIFKSLTASLRVIRGARAGHVFPIASTEVVIGRGEDCDIRIDDAKASRRHAQIRYEALEFRISDLGSGNGTLLNGSQVKEYALRDADKIAIGDYLFQFSVRESAGG